MRLRQMSGALAARGLDALGARETALRAIDIAVSRQATLISFERVFLLAGVLFFLVLPLLAFLKAPKTVEEAGGVPAPKPDVHVEI